jgi:hypothetical protein
MSDAAAERSAHGTRGGPALPAGRHLVRQWRGEDGQLHAKIERIAALEEEVAALTAKPRMGIANRGAIYRILPTATPQDLRRMARELETEASRMEGKAE